MKEKSCYNCENIICKQRKEKEGVDLVLSQCTAWEEKTVEEQNKDLKAENEQES
ncbi:MAG: hypothetical protein GX568_08890 [Candidatus Gastranaerophilales bacterium]|nr:hypothetical protein [Candidatus Gastranaerophilales bacterium]